MILMCEPVVAAVEAVTTRHPESPELIMLSPQGEQLTQAIVTELAAKPRLMFLCGRYEGFDDRIRQQLKPREVSIGDYVVSGGELPAMVLIDAVTRLLPGALGDEQSTQDESFSDGLLEYPHFTRPREFRGMSVPEVLISGDHAAIESWKRKQALERTRIRRPDLLKPDGEKTEKTDSTSPGKANRGSN